MGWWECSFWGIQITIVHDMYIDDMYIPACIKNVMLLVYTIIHVHCISTSSIRFIRSLSRCVKFDAKGGKSRSTFCKVIGKKLQDDNQCVHSVHYTGIHVHLYTCMYMYSTVWYIFSTDDRFIMKQIKSVEISSFEQIAPLYFEHVISALESKVSATACTCTCTCMCVHV